MAIDLYKEELRLEEVARMQGVVRFEEDTHRKMEQDQQSGTYFGTALLKRSIEPVADAIRTFQVKASNGKPGRRHAALRYLELVKPEVAAYMTARAVIDTYTKPRRATRMAAIIGGRLEDEVRYADFKEKAPGLWHVLSKQTKGSSDRHKRATLIHTYNKHVAEWSSWPETELLHVGMKLLELFIDATRFAELVQVPRPDGKVTPEIHPTPAVMEWLESSRDAASAVAPAYLPMVIPPVEWTSPYSGGYLSPTLKPVTVVKTRNRAYLEELTLIPDQMKSIYEAVNAVQSVPWRINNRVLDVQAKLWEQGSEVAGLPQRQPSYVPPYPFPHVDKEDLSEEEKGVVGEWKRKAAAIHAHNAKLSGRRVQVSRVLGIALQFAHYDEIYFPHTMDFRGRVYSVPMFLTPQGSDHAKGVLEFAEGKPIGGTTGPGWLAVQGANVWGYDKADFEGRIDWVAENEERILSCAGNPLGDLWWTEADKPWSFLAFCFEWTGFIEKGADHITHLPIAMDGSCSGLQHFSAALRDPVGGAAVNLVPSPKPADVYQEVADQVIAKLRLETTTCGSNSALAARILDFGVDRKATKRPTMTLPYGSTQYSCRTFIKDWMAEVAEAKAMQGVQNPLSELEDDAATYLSSLVWKSIGEVVIAAQAAMGWLRETAKVLSKENLPVYWTTPDGMPILQEYKNTALRRVKTRFGDRLIYLSLRYPTDDVDARRQASGIPPNWVHSMDATHLRMAVLYGKDNGITSFAVIHDSFGTHACDTDMLGACLRESMVELYEGDILGSFLSEISVDLPTSGMIPQMPEMGTLDLNLIKESDYVFA